MDNKTYDQVEIKKNVIGEKHKLLSEGLEVIIVFMEDKPISVELPNNIECTIETTDASIKKEDSEGEQSDESFDYGPKAVKSDINAPESDESFDYGPKAVKSDRNAPESDESFDYGPQNDDDV